MKAGAAPGRPRRPPLHRRIRPKDSLPHRKSGLPLAGTETNVVQAATPLPPSSPPTGAQTKGPGMDAIAGPSLPSPTRGLPYGPLSVPKRTKSRPAIPRFAPASSPAFLSPSLHLSTSPCFYKNSLLPSSFRDCMGVQTLPQSCLEKKTVVRSRSPRAFSPPLF